jgi:hypothetical protein
MHVAQKCAAVLVDMHETTILRRRQVSSSGTLAPRLAGVLMLAYMPVVRNWLGVMP